MNSENKENEHQVVRLLAIKTLFDDTQFGIVQHDFLFTHGTKIDCGHLIGN